VPRAAPPRGGGGGERGGGGGGGVTARRRGFDRLNTLSLCTFSCRLVYNAGEWCLTSCGFGLLSTEEARACMCLARAARPVGMCVSCGPPTPHPPVARDGAVRCRLAPHVLARPPRKSACGRGGGCGGRAPLSRGAGASPSLGGRAGACSASRTMPRPHAPRGAHSRLCSTRTVLCARPVAPTTESARRYPGGGRVCAGPRVRRARAFTAPFSRRASTSRDFSRHSVGARARRRPRCRQSRQVRLYRPHRRTHAGEARSTRRDLCR